MSRLLGRALDGGVIVGACRTATKTTGLKRSIVVSQPFGCDTTRSMKATVNTPPFGDRTGALMAGFHWAVHLPSWVRACARPAPAFIACVREHRWKSGS